jgi:hypothetical protein
VQGSKLVQHQLGEMGLVRRGDCGWHSGIHRGNGCSLAIFDDAGDHLLNKEQLASSCFNQSVSRAMVTHVHRDDLLVLNQQLQRDAVRQVDGHRMQAIELAAQGMQTQRGVRGIGQLARKGLTV